MVQASAYNELLNRIIAKTTGTASVTDKARNRAIEAFITNAAHYMSLADNTLFDMEAYSVGISPSELRDVIEEYNRLVLTNQGLSPTEFATTQSIPSEVAPPTSDAQFGTGITLAVIPDDVQENQKNCAEPLNMSNFSLVQFPTTHQIPDDVHHTNTKKPPTLKYAKTLTPEIHARILVHLAAGYTNTAIATLIQREFHTTTTESNIRNYVTKLSKAGLLPHRGKRRSL